MRTKEGVLAVRLDLECDKTAAEPARRAPLGKDDKDAALVARVGDPQGDAALLARWGTVLEDALWAALLQLVIAYATRLGAAPRGLIARNGGVTLVAGPPLRIDDPPAAENPR